MPVPHQCVDCSSLPAEQQPRTPRPAPHGGPRSRRCTTHHRAHTAARRARTRAAHKERRFGLDAELQQAVWEAQGCACPCGAKHAPTIPAGVAGEHDHEHARAHCDHDPAQGCRACFLGFTCMHCNTEILGRLTGRTGSREGAALALERLVEFIRTPPLARVLARATTRTETAA